MLPIKVQVLYNTEDTTTKENCGIPVDLSEYEQREMTFFTIDAIGSYKSDTGETYAKIFSSGAEFLTLITPNDLFCRIYSAP